MRNMGFAACAGVMALFLLGMTSAQAGGFTLGTADTDILFQEGNAARAGFSVLKSERKRASFAGQPVEGFKNPVLVVPTLAAKYKINDAFSCALTYTMPFGGHTDYSGVSIAGMPVGFDPATASTTGSTEQKFLTHEFGTTCAYGIETGKGRLSLLGGVFYQRLEFDQWLGGPGGPLQLHLEDGQLGWRVGAAYEIPEIALRAQLMYRSQTKIDASGDLSLTSGAVTLGPATGWGEFPQSLEAKVQTGIAPGWLVFGSARWVDWSVMDVVNYNTTLDGDQTLNFFWRDGWTLSGGVAHAFTDNLVGTVGLSWDRGVSTGHDIQTDMWALSFGGTYKHSQNIEIRGGLSFLFYQSGSQDFIQTGPGTSASFLGLWTADSDMGYVGSLSAVFKW
ncbi:OmpP1/FadL family transporter [Aquamicrobium segne]|uniref:OmpP1/FadL family transporter n=1 Tax=Aquamicrobium segne TaxID=469547 RepID=A0ABW0GZ81_9HYPH